MNDVQLRECVQFAESNGLYNLAFSARQRIQDFSILNDLRKRNKKEDQSFRKEFRKRAIIKKGALEYEFNRLKEDRLSYQNQALFKQLTYVIALFAALLIALVLVLTLGHKTLLIERLLKKNSNILLANYKIEFARTYSINSIT